VGRDEDIQAIVELGRRTRQPTPRWLSIVAAVVGVLCVVGFAAMLLGDREPRRRPPGYPADRRPEAGAGLGVGLMIGAGGGIVIGFAIGRQRRSHSSRKSP
jgi:drug/metabolite transporter (DMT)-like permease